MDVNKLPENPKNGLFLVKNHYFSPIFGSFLEILDENQF